MYIYICIDIRLVSAEVPLIATRGLDNRCACEQSTTTWKPEGRILLRKNSRRRQGQTLRVIGWPREIPKRS